jgi:hypothetical protein
VLLNVLRLVGPECSSHPSRWPRRVREIPVVLRREVYALASLATNLA